jgi:CheY-specific phosphatase CheX
MRVIYDHPGLKVIVTGVPTDSEDLVRLQGLRVSDIHCAPVEPAVLADTAVDALEDHEYDDEVVACLSSCLGEILVETRIEVEALPPVVRVGPRTLAEVTAVVELTGDVEGRISASASPLLFGRVARGWLGGRPSCKDAIWDAAGELINRVAGLVRSHYTSRGLDTRQSPPSVIDGAGVSLRTMANRPSMVVAFSVNRFSEPMYVELLIGSKRPDQIEEADEIFGSGELMLL